MSDREVNSYKVMLSKVLSLFIFLLVLSSIYDNLFLRYKSKTISQSSHSVLINNKDRASFAVKINEELNKILVQQFLHVYKEQNTDNIIYSNEQLNKNNYDFLKSDFISVYKGNMIIWNVINKRKGKVSYTNIRKPHIKEIYSINSNKLKLVVEIDGILLDENYKIEKNKGVFYGSIVIGKAENSTNLKDLNIGVVNNEYTQFFPQYPFYIDSSNNYHSPNLNHFLLKNKDFVSIPIYGESELNKDEFRFIMSLNILNENEENKREKYFRIGDEFYRLIIPNIQSIEGEADIIPER